MTAEQMNQGRRGKLAIRAAITVAILAFGIRGALTARQVRQQDTWFSARNAKDLAALIPGGIDINLRDRTGGTALDRAIVRGDVLSVRLLLDHGADAKQLGARFGNTPLATALRAMAPPPSPTGEPGMDDVTGIGPRMVAATFASALGPPGGGNPQMRANRREIVRLLLEHGAELNRSSGRSTPLGLAATTGDPELVKTVLDHGAEVDGRDRTGSTALVTAAATNLPPRRRPMLLDVCSVLLERGADPNARRDDGATALSIAARRRNEELVALLRKHGAKPSLLDACVLGDAKSVRQILADERDSRNAELSTALIAAARYGHTDAAGALLEHGADPNGAMAQPGNPLFSAAASGNTAMVRLLLDHGAKASGMPAEFVPLGACILGNEHPNAEIVQMLVKAGSPVDTRIHGWTYLLLAIKDGHNDAAKLLVEAGADVNARAPVDDPAIVLAAALARTEMVKLLLEHGADPRAVGRQGKTARQRTHNQEIRTLLAAAETRYAANSPR